MPRWYLRRIIFAAFLVSCSNSSIQTIVDHLIDLLFFVGFADASGLNCASWARRPPSTIRVPSPSPLLSLFFGLVFGEQQRCNFFNFHAMPVESTSIHGAELQNFSEEYKVGSLLLSSQERTADCLFGLSRARKSRVSFFHVACSDS